MKHHDIFSYLDEAFGFVDDELIDARLEEEIRDLKITGVAILDDDVLKTRITVEDKRFSK